MKERFSSAKSQLAKLIERSPADSHIKQIGIPVDTSHWNNDSTSSASQPTDHLSGSNKSVSETSTCARLDNSDASSFDSGIQGKIQRMMARTKNIEQKLITQLQTSPKNKVLCPNSTLKTEKLLKSFQKIDKFKQQLQNQPSVRDSFDDRRQFQVLETLWKELLNKSFELKTVDDDLPQLLRYVSEWKQNSKNYQILTRQILPNLQSHQSAEGDIVRILEKFLHEKNSMHEQLNTVNQQIHRLTKTISKLEEDRTFYVNQINQRDNKINFLDSQIERLKLNNNCLTEIIYKLQQKKVENDSRVQKGVYDHLQQQNTNLKNVLRQIVEQNKVLTIALTQEINFIREAILDEIKKKMLLHADLKKAESTIQQLRNMSVLDISQLKTTINRQFKLKHKQIYQQFIPQNYQHTSTEPSQEVQSDLLHSRLTESNQHIAHLQGLLDESRMINQNIETERNKLESANRKEEYQKQKIKKQVMEIRKVLCEGQEVKEAESLDAELMGVHHKAVEVAYKMKNIKEKANVMEAEYNKRGDELAKMVGEYEMLSKRYMTMRLAKNPSGNQEKLIELQNTNTQLMKDIEKLNENLKANEKLIFSKDHTLSLKHSQLLSRQQQLKSLLQTIQRLMTENRKLQQQSQHHRLQIPNPQRTQNVSQQDQFNEFRLQLQANMSDTKFDSKDIKSKINRMKSMSICSQQDPIIEDLVNNNYNGAKSIGQKSEISDCWNNTSGIHELAARIDSLGVFTFKIDELFDKYNVRGEIAEILSPFLKKLDKMRDLEELLGGVEQMLRGLKELSQICSEEDNAFLKFNLSRMGELFKETREYIEKKREEGFDIEKEDSDSQGEMDELTLHSTLKV